MRTLSTGSVVHNFGRRVRQRLFFFQAEDGIRYLTVTGVQTCALPILPELVVFGPDGKPNPAYPRMPNKPFRIDAPPVNRPPTAIVPGPIHVFWHNIEQINRSEERRVGKEWKSLGWPELCRKTNGRCLG